MERVRVIEFPPLKVVNSGNISSMNDFEAFDQWWSSIDAKHYIIPFFMIQGLCRIGVTGRDYSGESSSLASRE